MSDKEALEFLIKVIEDSPPVLDRPDFDLWTYNGYIGYILKAIQKAHGINPEYEPTSTTRYSGGKLGPPEELRTNVMKKEEWIKKHKS